MSTRYTLQNTGTQSQFIKPSVTQTQTTESVDHNIPVLPPAPAPAPAPAPVPEYTNTYYPQSDYNTQQHTGTYTLNAPAHAHIPTLPDLTSTTLLPQNNNPHTPDTKESKQPTKYHDYKNIDWYEFITAAIATGNAKAYCTAHNVCYTTYKRRQKLYNQLPDKTQLKTYKKQTNLAKRALSDAEQLAVRDEFLQGIGEGTIPNTNAALMRILTKHRNAAHPGKPPVTQLGNSVIQQFKKKMGITTIDLNKVQGKKRPAELANVMNVYQQQHGDIKRNSAKKQRTKQDSNTTADTEERQTSLIESAVQSVNAFASNLLQSMTQHNNQQTNTPSESTNNTAQQNNNK